MATRESKAEWVNAPGLQLVALELLEASLMEELCKRSRKPEPVTHALSGAFADVVWIDEISYDDLDFVARAFDVPARFVRSEQRGGDAPITQALARAFAVPHDDLRFGALRFLAL